MYCLYWYLASWLQLNPLSLLTQHHLQMTSGLLTYVCLTLYISHKYIWCIYDVIHVMVILHNQNTMLKINWTIECTAEINCNCFLNICKSFVERCLCRMCSSVKSIWDSAGLLMNHHMFSMDNPFICKVSMGRLYKW